jgi:hypothetical protein
MTIVDACQKVSVPRSAFYDICKRNPKDVATIKFSQVAV